MEYISVRLFEILDPFNIRLQRTQSILQLFLTNSVIRIRAMHFEQTTNQT